MNIADVEIGGHHPCRFVAELSNNHNGSLERALRLIRAAKDAGADLVKFQCYTPDELVQLRGDGPAPAQWGAQGWTMRALYEKAQTPHAWFPDLVAECQRVGIPWFSSVFGLESLALLERLGCPAYKIARLDNHQGGLLQAVASRDKWVLVSGHGNADPRYGYRIRGLYCPPGYPTPAAEVRLPLRMEKVPGDWLGLSSHCLAPELPIAAVARGAKLLEYHVQLDEEPSELEANISLTISQFRAMVDAVRRTEALLA